MAGNDNTYPNSKVGLEQGAGSNDTLFLDSDGYLRLNGTQYSGDTLDELLSLLQKQNAAVVMMESATVLSDQGDGSDPPILPSTYGFIYISGANVNNMSARMFSAGSAGRQLIIATRYGQGQSIIIACSGNADEIAGAVVIGPLGSSLSSFQLRGSAASQAYIKLVSDGSAWRVIEETVNANVTMEEV